MTKAYYRDSIYDYLKGMSDIESQSDIGPEEAFCLWFDDLYVPCFDSTIYNEQSAIEIFRSCFNNIELLAMVQYHNYIQSIVDEFDTNRDWSQIQNDPDWIRLTEEAKTAFNVFKQSE